MATDNSPMSKVKSGCLFIILIFGFSFWMISGGNDPIPLSDESNWYIGEDLTHSNGIDWQNASEKDKLATCANILATFWDSKKLSDRVLSRFSTMEQLKPVALELKNNIDVALSKFDDPEENHKVLTNQNVGETAVLLMTLDGWLN